MWDRGLDKNNTERGRLGMKRVVLKRTLKRQGADEREKGENNTMNIGGNTGGKR